MRIWEIAVLSAFHLTELNCHLKLALLLVQMCGIHEYTYKRYPWKSAYIFEKKLCSLFLWKIKLFLFQKHFCLIFVPV